MHDQPDDCNRKKELSNTTSREPGSVSLIPDYPYIFQGKIRAREGVKRFLFNLNACYQGLGIGLLPRYGSEYIIALNPDENMNYLSIINIP